MKKNIHFRRIPDYIEQELRNIQEQHVIVAAIINIKKSDIARGAYRHLGIKMTEGDIVFPDSVYPDKLAGIYARRNLSRSSRLTSVTPTRVITPPTSTVKSISAALSRHVSG